MYNRENSYCPYCMQQNVCPFFYEQMRKFNNYDHEDETRGDNQLQHFDLFSEESYLNNTRAPEQDVTRIYTILNNQQPQLLREIQRVIENYVRTAISFTLDESPKYGGNINQKINTIYNNFRRRYDTIFSVLSASGLPNNVVNRTFRDIIEFTLRNSTVPPVPVPPPPGPQPPPEPGDRWSQWEDLGGVLNFSPAVSSWAPNRLDVFVTGTDSALYHKYWNGSRWSEYENLGGILTSAPAAVSWGNNRIDIFGRGTTNSMYHKYFDGSNVE